MVSKRILLIITALVFWCGGASLHAQSTDSTAIDSSVEEQDTILPADDTSSVNYGQDEHHNNSAELAKFETRQPQDVPAERHLPDSTSQKLKKDKDYWFADKEAGKEQEETKQADDNNDKGFWYYFWKVLNSRVFYVVFWVVLVAAFALLIFIYFRTFSAGSRKIRKGSGMEPETNENIFAINFDEQLQKAINEKNYRMATRLLFLRLLRSMSERNIIVYGIDKTNMDYLFELGNTRHSKDFMRASRTYEFVWYGNFTIEQSQFLNIRQMLDDIQQKVLN